MKLKTWCAEHRARQVEVARSLDLPRQSFADRLMGRKWSDWDLP